MTRLIKRALWFLVCATIIGVFIVGQITHKEITWLANPAWFFAWMLILGEIILAFILLGMNSSVDDAIAGKKNLDDGFVESLKKLSERSFSNRVFHVLYRITDLVMVVALVCAGWFFSAFVYLVCSQCLTPELTRTLEKKYRKYSENKDADDAPVIDA